MLSAISSKVLATAASSCPSLLYNSPMSFFIGPLTILLDFLTAFRTTTPSNSTWGSWPTVVWVLFLSACVEVVRSSSMRLMYLMGSPVVAEKVLYFLMVGWNGDLDSSFMIALGIQWWPMRATPSLSIDQLRKQYNPLTSICAALFLFPAEVTCKTKRSSTFLFFLLHTAITKLLKDISRIQITKNKYTYRGMDDPRQF